MYHRTYLAPERLPVAELAGTDRDIPTVTFGHDFRHEVQISLGNHPDAAGYLRDLASLCIGLAEQVDALAATKDAPTLEVCS